MNLSIALKLGRVSNLPTVWTNCLAGAVLSGVLLNSGSFTASTFGWDARLLLVIMAMTLSYVGGMFLNDAFDAVIDAKERPERPIPSGQVSRQAVFLWGGTLLATSVLLLLLAGFAGGEDGTRWQPALAGLALAGFIVLYNVWHKSNPISPLIMGMCRVCVYAVAALVFISPVPMAAIIGSALLLCYLIGLTYVAKQENLGELNKLWPLIFLALPLLYGLVLAISSSAFTIGIWLILLAWVAFCLWILKRRGPGDIPRAVVSLIAGISLLDALLIAASGQWLLAVVCLAGFGLTLFLQRYIAGT